jgi:hypothetical protein
MGNRSEKPFTSLDIVGNAAFGFSGRRHVSARQTTKSAGAFIPKSRISSFNVNR